MKKAFGFRLINELSENSVRANIRKHSGTTNICFKSLVQSAAGCTVIAAHWSPAMHPAQGRSSKTITLNTKQMALGDLAKGEKQLRLVLWPISLFPFSEYSFILTPASHFIMIYSGENAGGGGEYVCVCRGGGDCMEGGPPKGLFSQLMTRNTLLFFAGQTFAVHKHVEGSDRQQKLWRKAGVPKDVNGCLFYARMHYVCHKQAGWEVLGPDEEITKKDYVQDRKQSTDVADDGQLLQHNSLTLQ